MTPEEKKTLENVTSKFEDMDHESKTAFMGAMLGAALVQDIKEVTK